MLKTAAIIAAAVVALSATEVAHAHERGQHRADRHVALVHSPAYVGHRGYERRVIRRADRRAYHRALRTSRWVADHRPYVYDGRGFRHRHGLGAWHWHGAPRYRYVR